MLKAIFSTLRFIILILAGHKEIALENAALRQQLTILKREQPRPKLRHRDRLFWIALMKIWKQWRTVPVVVQPATVVSWQRRRFKQYWRKLSQNKSRDVFTNAPTETEHLSNMPTTRQVGRRLS